MSLPVNIDNYGKYVVQNDDELLEQHVPPAIVERVHRLRALYAYWLQFPSKFDKDIVMFDIAKFKVSKSQAYDDLRLTQTLLGNFQQASKEFMRWKINQDLEEDLKQARRARDFRSVASIEKNRILNNRTDKDDELEIEYDKIIPQTFEPTSDPSVIGIASWKGRVPQLRARIKELTLKYSKDMIVEDADYEELNENEESEES